MTTIAAARATLPRPARVPGDLARQVLRYGLVGVLGTAVSTLLYLVFRTSLDAVPANLAALALTTLATTGANRRFTFRATRTDRRREFLQNAGTVVFCAGNGSLALLLLSGIVDDPTALQESLTVAAVSVLGGVVRFVVLRDWVFAPASPVRPAGARAVASRLLVAVAASGGGES